MTTVLRNRLTVSALAAASSLIAISAPAHAQSICTPTGTSVLCPVGSVTAVLDATTVVVPSAQGIVVTDPDTLAATLSGAITTSTGANALSVTTLGNLSLLAGANGVATVATTGTGAAVTLNSTTGTVNANLGALASVNNYALLANSETGATVSTGNITATNVTTLGLGGIIGTGAAVTSNTGPASLTVNGSVNVSGTTDPLAGALAVSVNGPATAAVTGNVTVNNTAGNTAIGVAALGGTNATVTVGGATNVTGTDGVALTAIAPNGIATVTCGAVTATGAGNTGVVALGTSAVVNCGNIAVTGADTTGLEARGTGTGTVNATVGNVTATGAGALGVEASTANGNLTLNTGLVTSTGAGVLTRSVNGNQLVTVAGAQTGGTAVDAQATGTGNVTVTTTAPVVSTGGLGIRAVANTGNVAVNAGAVNGSAGAILATNTGPTSSTVTVRATGGLITSAAADAISIVTPGTAVAVIDANGNVQGQFANDALDIRGATANTITVNGTLGSGGTGNAINAVGGATTVTVGSTGNVNGPIQLTGNADTINNAGAFTFRGTSNFGAGTDVFTNTGNLSLTQGATVNGLETLTNGASGTILVNGTTTLNGTTLGNAGQLINTGGAGTLSGLTAFNSTGLITMVDGAANDTLTINAPYNGSGAARLAVDVDGNLNAADRLVVNGAITGSTVIDVNLVGSPLYNPTGVVIVDGSSTVSAGAFTLAPADAQIGFLNYGLRQSGNDTLLASSLDPSFTDVAMLGSLGQELWYQSFDAYHDAIRGRHAGSLVSGHPFGVWGQLYESKDRYGDSNAGSVSLVNPVTGTAQSYTYSDRMRTHRRGAQVGLEFRGTGFVIGATGGYEWARTEDQPMVARLKAEGHNYGAYALFGMASGLYAGLMVKRDDYHVNFANDARAVTFRNKAHSTGGDAEIGFRTGNAAAIGFDLNAGMSYVETKIDGLNQYGLTFDFQDNKSWRGRLGARVFFPQAMGAFVGAKVFHEFKDDGYLAVRTAGNATVADIDMTHRGTWVRLEGGLDGSGTGGAILTLWGDLGDTKSFGGRVGFRF